MSVESTPDIRAIRARLRNPPNGIKSSALDVISKRDHQRASSERRDKQRRTIEAINQLIEVEREQKLPPQSTPIPEIVIPTYPQVIVRYIKTSPWNGGERRIKLVVSEYYGYNPKIMEATIRDAPKTVARHIAMMLCRDELMMSSPRIGRVFGSREHSSVLQAIKSLKRKMDQSQELRDDIANIRRLLETKPTYSNWW